MVDMTTGTHPIEKGSNEHCEGFLFLAIGKSLCLRKRIWEVVFVMHSAVWDRIDKIISEKQ
jgi:hypothetical protein